MEATVHQILQYDERQQAAYNEPREEVYLRAQALLDVCAAQCRRDATARAYRAKQRTGLVRVRADLARRTAIGGFFASSEPSYRAGQARAQLGG